jgi:2-hydroxy-3-keto-5-methylthiopentenyl-1-phosphate phosphatase
MEDMLNKIIFCDFDGTVTKQDTIDSLLEMYANKEWHFYEEQWANNEIGSKECLEKQIGCIDNFTSVDFQNFINTVEIDETFINFYKDVLENKIPFYIISDGFRLIIESVFEKYNLPIPTIFSNEIVIENCNLIPSFPKSNPAKCLVKAGMCKCSVIELEKKEIVYIGDGRSDLCASRLVKTLFAKGKLQTLCQEINRDYIPFTNFLEIQNCYLK